MAGTKPGVVLQPRDYRLLRTLAMLRVVDREAAKAIGPFSSTTRANTRLQALVLAGLLMTHAVGTIAGGHKHLYALTAKGARIADVAYRAAPWSKDTLLAGSIGLEHQLRLNAVYLLLMHPAVPRADMHVRTWRTFARPLPGTTKLIPDAYVEVEIPSGIRGWFVEVDRGTETRRTWRSKAERYLRYATSGAFASTTGLTQFGILVIAPSERRVHSLRPIVATVTTKLFWFAEDDVLTLDAFWSSSWWRPTGDDRQSLIPSNHPCGTAPTVGA